MVVVVDANILISASINPKSKPALLLQNSSSLVDFVIPEFIFYELKKNEQKILKAKKDYARNLLRLTDHALIINENEIEQNIFERAYNITRDIDKNDTIYVAFAIALEALLWTRDLKLYRGLRKKGHTNVVTTSELKDIVRGIYKK